MKTRLLLRFVVFGLLLAINADAYSTANLLLPVRSRKNRHPISGTAGTAVTANLPAKKKRVLLSAKNKLARRLPLSKTALATTPRSTPGHLVTGKLTHRAAALDSVTELLRLKLIIDQYNYDDIAIGFNSGTTPVYNYNYDSEYLPGIDAPEGLASYSSDGVALSVNFLPLPKSTPDVIRLDVRAMNSGPFTLKRTELDSLPSIYGVWLMDAYAKDSINLRTDSVYPFTINKADTASFGSYRFKVIVRQNPVPAFQLTDFNATKAATGAEITWTTLNEENYTIFSVERSSDGGDTFSALTTFVSSGLGSYTYTDTSPPEASDEYRLKVTDHNDTVSYSNTVTLLYGKTINTIAGNISIYPNPTSSVINLAINQTGSATQTTVLASQSVGISSSLAATVNNSSSSSYNIKIINASGAVIKSATSSSGTWQDNVGNLSPGTYIITVVNSSNNSLVGRSSFVKL